MIETLRVLILDGDLQGELAESVSSCGKQVVSVATFEEVSALLKSEQADVLLMEIDPTSPDGMDLLRSAVCRFPQLPVIVVLAQLGFTLAPEAIRAGAYDYLAKPLSRDLVDAALKRVKAAVSQRKVEEAMRLKGLEMAALHRATNAITASLESDDVLSQILAETSQILGAERTSVLLRDERTGSLYFLASSDAFQELSGLEVPIGKGLANWCIANNQAVLSNEAPNDPRFYQGIDQVSGYRTQSLVAAPLRVQSKVIGAIEAINKIDGSFGENDLFLLQALALSAAAALRNAALYREQLESRDLMQAVLNAASSGMAAVDLAGVVLFQNPAASATFGLVAKTEPMQNVIEMINAYADNLKVLKPEGATWQDYRKAVLTAREPKEFVLEIAGATPRVLDALISPVTCAPGSIVARLLAWRDITQERALEQWRDDLSQIIIHDLRNPLSLIRVGIEAAQLFLSPDSANADSLQGLSLALQGVAQLERRTEILLAVNNLEAGLPLAELSPIPLEEIAEAAQVFYGFESQERTLDLAIDIPDDLPVIYGDRDVIEWTVGNMVYFALKHSPRPGTVTIQAEKEGSGIMLSVYNPALHLPPDTCAHMFDKFSRQEGDVGVGSSGVGLYFCKLAAQAHHGHVSVECGPKHGYALRLWLPSSPADAPQAGIVLDRPAFP